MKSIAMIVEISFLLRLSSCILIDMDYVSCTIKRTHAALAEQLVKRTLRWVFILLEATFIFCSHQLSTADRRHRHQCRLLSQSDTIRSVLIGLLKPTNNCHERTSILRFHYMSFSTFRLSSSILVRPLFSISHKQKKKKRRTTDKRKLLSSSNLIQTRMNGSDDRLIHIQVLERRSQPRKLTVIRSPARSDRRSRLSAKFLPKDKIPLR